MEQFRETTFHVKGMTCGSCLRHIDKALRQLRGVADVEVTLAEGRVLVAHDPTTATEAKILAALTAAGYPSSLLEPS